MNEVLLQQLSDDFRFITHDKAIIATLPENIRRNRKYKDYSFDQDPLDPREWLPIPDNESEEEAIKRYKRQVYNTFVRTRIYAYQQDIELEDYQLSDEINSRIKDFNDRNVKVIANLLLMDKYPRQEDVVSLLHKMSIPDNLQGLTVKEVFLERLRYPYAWFDIELPQAWKEEIKSLFEKHFSQKGITGDIEGLNIGELNRFIGSKWSYRNSSSLLLYDAYMNILNEAPPLPNSIVLFRGFNYKTPKVGDEIIEYGFSSKSYSYYISSRYADETCCTFIISYPKGHKFIMPRNAYKREFLEIMSYPGEVLKVDEVDNEKVFCHFVRYEPHVAPNGEVITPVMTDIFEEVDSCGLIKSVFYDGTSRSMTSAQLSRNREQCKSAIYQEGYSISLTLNPIIM